MYASLSASTVSENTSLRIVFFAAMTTSTSLPVSDDVTLKVTQTCGREDEDGALDEDEEEDLDEREDEDLDEREDEIDEEIVAESAVPGTKR